MSERVLGVDACRKGWVGITGDLRAYFGVTIAELVSAAEQDGELRVMGIDIPIGLPSVGSRQADVLARTVVGKRWPSVFITPTRAALSAPGYDAANTLSKATTGHGISRQAYGLAAKILDVDGWVPKAPCPVLEVHPEVCFATMAGRPLAHAKSTWAGGEERRRLLADSGMPIGGDLGLAGALAAADDILDAAAVAWSAQRYAEGRAHSYPDPPEILDDGTTAAIWA